MNNVIPMHQANHAQEIGSALLLLKVFNIEGGHSPQVIDEVITKAQIELTKLQEQMKGR